MKGSYQRYLKRQERNQMTSTCNEVAKYAAVLMKLTEVAGDGKSYRQGEEQLITRLKPNVTYAVRAEDDTNYFRSVMIKKVELTGGYQLLVSNPVYGSVPNGIVSAIVTGKHWV